MRGPRFAEALLRGFIADPGLEEAILGDLAEEWSDRADRAGPGPASAWYWGQVLRSVPHLLRHWWLQESPDRAARGLGRVSLVLILALALAAVTTAGMLIVAGGAPGQAGPDATRAILVAGGGWAGVAGFVLACRTADAPMASAVLLGLGWIPTTVPAALVHPTPGPAGWFFVAYPTLLFALTVTGGAVATMLRGPRPRAHTRPTEPDPSTLEDAMQKDDSPFRLAARPLLAAAAVLAVPLVAMQFTDEVVWTLSDFVLMGTLVLGTGVLFELALARTESTAYRAAAGLALAAAFLLFWVNGAVGIIGSADNAANLMHLGVLAVGVGGAIGAGGEARGLARAMVSMALLQLAVGGIALLGGLGGAAYWQIKLIAVTGFFVALFVGSAWLFRMAARRRSPAGQAPAG